MNKNVVHVKDFDIKNVSFSFSAPGANTRSIGGNVLYHHPGGAVSKLHLMVGPLKTPFGVARWEKKEDGDEEGADKKDPKVELPLTATDTFLVTNADETFSVRGTNDYGIAFYNILLAIDDAFVRFVVENADGRFGNKKTSPEIVRSRLWPLLRTSKNALRESASAHIKAKITNFEWTHTTFVDFADGEKTEISCDEFKHWKNAEVIVELDLGRFWAGNAGCGVSPSLVSVVVIKHGIEASTENQEFSFTIPPDMNLPEGFAEAFNSKPLKRRFIATDETNNENDAKRAKTAENTGPVFISPV